jgi:Phospholipase_D-nuclease N-terminal
MTSLLLASGHPDPSGHRLFLALLPVLVVALGLDVYCLVSLVRAPSVRYLPKAVWALIIVCVSCPLGALLYLFLGRQRNQGSKVPG